MAASPAVSPFLPGDSFLSFSPGTDASPAQRRAATGTPGSASSVGGGSGGAADFCINVQRESPVEGPFLFAPGKKSAQSPSTTQRDQPLSPSWGASEAQGGGGGQGTQASPPLSFSFSAGLSPSSAATAAASPAAVPGVALGGTTPFTAPQTLFGQAATPSTVTGVDPSAFAAPFTFSHQEPYREASRGRRDPRGGVARPRAGPRPAQSDVEDIAEAVSRLHVNDDLGSPKAAPGPTVPDIVSKLRDEGTALYRRGQFDRAEAKYTEALAYVGPAGAEVQTRTALLCNRAAARLTKANLASSTEAAWGTLDALQDCLSALELEPDMARAQERAGACMLRVGRFAAAVAAVAASASGGAPAASSRVMAGVTAGATRLRAALDALAAAGVELWLLAAQQLPTEEVGPSPAPPTDPAALLALVDEALSHAPFCLAAARAKVEALLLLRRPKCAREALAAAALASTVSDRVDKLLAATPYGQPGDEGGTLDWWLPWTTARLDLAAGNVDAAEAALVGLGPAPAAARQALAALRAASGARAAGNELFKARRWSEAVDAYSQGLSAWARQPGGITISAAGHQLATLLCNRAAALHAKGMRLEATADAGAALALCHNHAKALSRRAALYMEMRMPKEALEDLKALKATAGGQGEYSANNLAGRFREAEAAVRGKAPPEACSMLGFEKATFESHGFRHGAQFVAEQEQHTVEVKKAFRRAALRLHPDKAVTAVPAGAFAGVEAALRADAERLFRLASDAAAKLGDQDSRDAYLAEERRRAGASAAHRGGFNAGPFGGPYAAGRQPPFRDSYGARSGFHWNTGVYHDFEEDEEGYHEEEEEPEPDLAELARQQEVEAAAALRRAQAAYDAARRAREQAQRAATGARRHY